MPPNIAAWADAALAQNASENADFEIRSNWSRISGSYKAEQGHPTKNWSRDEVKQIYYEAEEITKNGKFK